MPVTIKSSQVKVKGTDGYVSIDALADSTTASRISAINSAGASALEDIQIEGQSNVSSIEQKGAEVLESIPDEYTQLENDVSELKSALTKTTNYDTDFTDGAYIALNGGIGNVVNVTPVVSQQRAYKILPCKRGNTFTLTAGGGSAPRAWGFTDQEYTLLSVANNGSNPVGIVLTAENDGYLIVNHDITKQYSLVATQMIDVVDADGVDAIASEAVEDNNSTVLGLARLNYFDKTTIVEGKYPNPSSGALNVNSEYFASDYIDVDSIGSPVMVYGSQYVHCYDASKASLGSTAEADTRSQAKAQTLLPGTKYVIVSAANGYLDLTQVGNSILPGQKISFYAYKLDNLLLGKSQVVADPVIVDINGSGDYTSFTLACKEHYNDHRDIIVKPGVYDINDEYIDIWGESAVANMADADTETFDGWQYGVKMNGRKFIFEPGSKIVCDRTNYTVNSTHRFSALRVEMDVEIEGLYLVGTHLFYCIHDDYGVQTRPYTVKYRNCTVIGNNLTNSNCIGGGCKKWSRHILENCFFNNNASTKVAVRYHNTNIADAVPEIYVSNCYFNTSFTPCWYGAQETLMRVYVNNCEANSIHKVQESSSFTFDNVELNKWCCTEKSPVN